MYEFTDYLEHHGVLGMKWGVRRFQNKDGTRIKGAASKVKRAGSNAISTTKSLGSSAKRKSTAIAKQEAANRKRISDSYKESKTMTDSELNSANKRYEAEQKYRNNVKKDVRDSRSSTGQLLSRFGNQTVNSIIGGTAAGVGSAAVTLLLTRKIGKAIKGFR